MDSIIISGYVNVTGRDSEILNRKPYGNFVEQVLPKVFEESLHYFPEVKLTLNHNYDKCFGSSLNNNVELFEDNIGLFIYCKTYDKEVIEKALNHEFVGWSFSFDVIKDRVNYCKDKNIKRRYLEKLKLTEISLLDRTNKPAYKTTSLNINGVSEYLYKEH